VGTVVLAAKESYPAPPEQLFGLFGSSGSAGWLFGAQCDALAPGGVVTIVLPLGTGPGDGQVQILGRVARLVPNRQIVIWHDQPWRGTLKIKFDRLPDERTGVTVLAELDEDGLGWLMRRRGWPAAADRNDRVHRVGLLTSKSGPGAVFAVACENMARMAVEELNACGGLRGRPVELLVGDDATDPQLGAAEARRLIASGCRVVLASVTSATFQAVQRENSAAGVPLIHPVLNEGGGGVGHVLRWGERPANQLGAAAAPFMKATGARHWFLVGNDYSWSHGAHAAARTALPRAGGRIIGEQYVPLGTEDFGPVIERIERARADCVLSTLVGADEVAFERQSWQLGLRSKCRTLALVLDESTRERIGDAAAGGLWTAFGYFQQLDTDSNASFLARYRAAYGTWAPPVSSLSEAVYESVQLYAGAVRATRDDDPAAVARALHHHRADMPRGEVALSGPHSIRQAIHVAEATTGGFRLLRTTH
jgi:branched-chain amino acid transport system substrate-binding protein